MGRAEAGGHGVGLTGDQSSPGTWVRGAGSWVGPEDPKILPTSTIVGLRLRLGIWGYSGTYGRTWRGTAGLGGSMQD